VIAPDLGGLGDSSRAVTGYDKTGSNDIWRLVHDVMGERRFFVVGHDWGGPVAFALAAQHRDAVRRLAILDVPVPGDGTPVMFANRRDHGLHWKLDFPEALTAGREDIYLGFFYRQWRARPTRSLPKRKKSTFVPIACQERCGRASISTAQYPMT